MKTRAYTIVDALDDPALLGAALGPPTSWKTWRVVLKSAFGIGLDQREAEAFAEVAGGRSPPTKRVRELWAVVGRRGGKSRIAAALAVYLAAFCRYRLSHGETGMVLVLAASRDQGRVVYDYIVGFIKASPILRGEIANETAHEITLQSGIVIAVHSNSFRTVRGRTLVACIFDEVAFWRDESSAIPDIECYRGVLPALATTNGMLIGISSPYRKAGLLHQKHRDHFGQDGDEVLVVQGPTRSFNPTLPASTIDLLRQADPTAADSEWEAVFRDDISSFLDDQLIDAAIEHGRPLELAPSAYPEFYRAFCDASGGVGQDSYTLSIAHKEKDHFVIDLVRGTSGKFDPAAVTAEYAALCKEYRITSVTGDRYSANWVSEAWAKCGVSYVVSDIPKSQIYLECLPLFTRGLVRLPDHAKLLRELRLLERQTHRGGRESVDHPRGGRDDHANAVAGVLRTLSNYLAFNLSWDWIDGRPDPAAAETDEQRRERQHQEAAAYCRVHNR
jgi:hypothetical protein